MKFGFTAIAAIIAVAWLLGRSSASGATVGSGVAGPSPTQPVATPLTVSTFDVVKLGIGAVL